MVKPMRSANEKESATMGSDKFLDVKAVAIWKDRNDDGRIK